MVTLYPRLEDVGTLHPSHKLSFVRQVLGHLESRIDATHSVLTYIPSGGFIPFLNKHMR